MSVKCGREDCFGYSKGACKVLAEGFSKPCPFYKTRQQHFEDVARKNKRLIDLGLYGAMEAAYKVRERGEDDD